MNGDRPADSLGTVLQTAGGNVTFWFLGLSSWLVLGSALVDLCAGGVQIPLDSKRPPTHQFSSLPGSSFPLFRMNRKVGERERERNPKSFIRLYNCLRELVMQSSRIQRGMIQSSSQRNLKVFRDIGSGGRCSITRHTGREQSHGFGGQPWSNELNRRI